MPTLFIARVLPTNLDLALKKQWNEKSTRGALVAALVNTKKEVLKEFMEITATWNHKPVFTSKLRYAGGAAIIEVTTNDKIFHFLDAGTIVRYVPMKRQPPFRPKTRTGFSASWPGQGGPVLGKDGKPFILKGRKAKKTITTRGGKTKTIRVPVALPGIKARQFGKTIKTMLDRRFAARVDRAVFRR